MSESNIQQNAGKPGDEIDIFEFCSKIWITFKNFLMSVKELIVSFIILLIRKSLWIGTFALFGMIFGFAFYTFTANTYVFAIEGDTGGTDNSVVIDHINRLNQLRGKPELLAVHLGMNVEQVKAIKSIQACYGIDINKDGRWDYIDSKGTYNPRDTMQVRVPSFIHIRLSVYDENILPALREGLFQYIKNNAYIQRLHEIDREYKRALIIELDKEIAKVVRLQEARLLKEASNIEINRMLLQLSEPEPKLFYADILSLYNQKQSIQRIIDISDEIIVVIQDLAPVELEERPLLKYTVIFGVAMAVLGLFCALCWQYRKRIWELIREDSTKP